MLLLNDGLHKLIAEILVFIPKYTTLYSRIFGFILPVLLFSPLV